MIAPELPPPPPPRTLAQTAHEALEQRVREKVGRSLVSYDSETPRFRAGYMAPRIVCASAAEFIGGRLEGELLCGPDAALDRLEAFLDAGRIIAFANAAYDLAVATQRRPHLLAKILRAIREGRVHDILLSEGLDAIYGGHLGYNPDGSEMRKSTGEVTNRYSLEIVHRNLTGRADAKQNDVFRESYAILEGVPPHRWPPEASQYPIDDARNTLEDAAIQIVGRQPHVFIETLVGPEGARTVVAACRHCGALKTTESPGQCPRAPAEAYQNQQNLPAQVEFALAQQLGGAWSLRSDPARVAKLSAEVEEKHAVAVERFQKKGWIREDGTEDQAAVKRAIATAYGATGVCKRCGGGARCRWCEGSSNDGTGRCRRCDGLGAYPGQVQKWEESECRGAKERGRYRGCLGAACTACGGSGKVVKPGSIVTCKNVFDEAEILIEEGCDGTGLDLSTAPFLKRTDKLGVAKDRDTAMESGDDDVSDYGENEFEKSRSTFVPYLIKGTSAPLWISGNALLASGRCSYEGCPVHQFPREGAERGCIRARGAWCGCPLEYVLGSTDYSAGELCCLAQYTYWLFGYSQMREAINASGDPGILHSELAAEVLGLPLAEFLARLKSGDKQATIFRQAQKPMNFGKPAGMGAAKIVLTNRKKAAGFTVCERGPVVNAKGEPGYWGIRFCVSVGGASECGVEKITQWHENPTAPVCRACAEAVEFILTPAYFRRFPEIKDYHKWGKKMVKERRPVPSVVWDEEAGSVRIVRERGFLNWDMELSALLNNGFQSMLADIGKHAYCTIVRECYLGVRDDGSPSPLAGCRAPLFMHDEPVTELLLDGAHLSGPRVAEIMVDAGKRLAPDVAWVAETALAFWWDKGMKSKYDSEKRLIPWGPVPDYLQHRYAA